MRPFAEIVSRRDVRLVDFGGDGGAFVFNGPDRPLRIIASWGGGWDHVSVSTNGKTPTWGEMEAVKRLCFHDHEAAMQLHVPVSDHISIKHNCLHIWRPQSGEILLPPKWMV